MLPYGAVLQHWPEFSVCSEKTHRSRDFGEDEQKRKRRGCVAGSLQYPHAGKQKEGEDNGTSWRKECAERTRDLLNVPCCSCNLCLVSCAVQGQSVL